MTQSEFLPLNPFEITLVGAMRGEISRAEFFQAFIQSELAIPTSTDVLEDGSGMTPFFFDKEGVQMLAVYTHRDRVKHLGEPGIYCLIMRGRDFLFRMPPEFGIVVNAGFAVGFDMSPVQIRDIVREFCSHPT